MLKMLQEPVLILKHAHETPLPPWLPHQCTSQLPKSYSICYLTSTPEGCGKPAQGNRNKKQQQKSWLNSQEQQCQTWLASSTSKYILPLLMPPFSSPKFFTPLFRSPWAGLFATIPLQHTPSSARQKLSPFLDLLRAPGIAEQSTYRPSPQPKLADTVLLRALK